MTIDLDHLKTVWKQEGQTAPDLPSLDILVKQTKRRNRLTWFWVAVEIILLSGLLAALLYLIFTSDGWLVRSLLGVSALMLIAVQIWMLKARSGLWRISAMQADQHARLHTRQAELNLKFARFARIAAPVGLIIGYATMSLHSGTVSADLSQLAIATVAVVGYFLFCRHWIGRRQAELNSARSIERELG